MKKTSYASDLAMDISGITHQIINITLILLNMTQYSLKSNNGGGRIKPLLKIFNECKSLTGVGELNPYWRSSMNGRV